MTRSVRAAVEAGSRVASLDVLRGVGILGILLVHIQSFSSVRAVYASPRVYGDLSGWNWWAWLGTYLFADGKFIAIFAMLFGAGFVVLANRHERMGRSAAGLHYRRMAGLFVIGLLHAYGLWYGDMLVSFSVCGAIVFGYRHLSPGRLIVLGVIVFFIGSLVSAAVVGSMTWWPDSALARLQESWSRSKAVIAWVIEKYGGT